MRRRCGWCGTTLRWYQMNLCHDCGRDFRHDAPSPKHREASRWERWLEREPQLREIDLPPTTTELERVEYEDSDGEISLRWHDTPDNGEEFDEITEKE